VQTIQIGDRHVPLKAPKSPTVCWEIAQAAATNPSRAFAAALGVCGPALQLNAKYRGDVLAYGLAVMDELVGRGIKAAQVYGAGALAYNECAAAVVDLPGEEEVADREGFSGREADSTTPSSTSPASGAPVDPTAIPTSGGSSG